jgi:uncharacterized membrane protein HdeD (DUF308 family)
MNIETTLNDGEQLLARVWKLIAAQGVIAIAFGIVLLVWPSIGLAAMTGIVGAFALITGCAAAVAAFRLPKEARDARIWLALQGVIGLAIGFAVLAWPNLSAKALLYTIAIWAIMAGAARFWASIAVPLTGAESLLLALNGIVLTAFGVIMFVKPGTGAIGLLALVAAYAIVDGVFALGLARELRHAVGSAKRFTPRPTPRPAVQR